METTSNRRIEARLSYKWPVLFAEDFTESVSQGVMIDVSSGGLAFMCRADESCPKSGQVLATRFSIPRSDDEDSSAMTSFTRKGRVLRVVSINASLRKVAIQFDEPLTLKPCEQATIDMMHKENKS